MTNLYVRNLVLSLAVGEVEFEWRPRTGGDIQITGPDGDHTVSVLLTGDAEQPRLFHRILSVRVVFAPISDTVCVCMTQAPLTAQNATT